MTEHKVAYACFMCGSQFRMGPHVYDGKHIHSYDISVCKSCYDGNWDGWASHNEQRLLAHLKERGLPVPKRNEKDRLPRE